MNVGLDHRNLISDAEADECLQAGQRVCFMWNGPPYDPDDFARADAFAERYGELPWIAFGGHHFGEPFDCRLLLQLPHVRTLTLHCRKLVHFEALRELEQLQLFRLSCYLSDVGLILEGPHLRNVHTLEIGETKRRNIDLAPLSQMSKLTDLKIEGQSKHIEAIAELCSLRRLDLRRLSRDVGLAFVSRINGLEHFTLGLGSRKSIDEVVHSRLAHLSIGGVLGLTGLQLDSFPRLVSLAVDAQKQITKLDFPRVLDRLQTIRLLTLKGLVSVSGIASLKKLRSLLIVETKLDFDEFRGHGLPASLEKFTFLTRRVGGDARIRAALDAEGFKDILNAAP